jgi:hypothetical protein
MENKIKIERTDDYRISGLWKGSRLLVGTYVESMVSYIAACSLSHRLAEPSGSIPPVVSIREEFRNVVVDFVHRVIEYAAVIPVDVELSVGRTEDRPKGEFFVLFTCEHKGKLMFDEYVRFDMDTGVFVEVCGPGTPAVVAGTDL